MKKLIELVIIAVLMLFVNIHTAFAEESDVLFCFSRGDEYSGGNVIVEKDTITLYTEIPQNGYYEIELINSTSGEVYYEDVLDLEQGNYKMQFSLGSNCPTGKYEITLYNDNYSQVYNNIFFVGTTDSQGILSYIANGSCENYNQFFELVKCLGILNEYPSNVLYYELYEKAEALDKIYARLNANQYTVDELARNVEEQLFVNRLMFSQSNNEIIDVLNGYANYFGIPEYESISDDWKWEISVAVRDSNAENIAQLKNVINAVIDKKENSSNIGGGSGGGGGGYIPIQGFCVKFYDINGEVISEQIVKELEAAVEPRINELVEIDGQKYVFDCWDKDFSSIIENTEIRPIYLPQYSIVFIADGKIVKIVDFNSETTNVNIPDVPEKSGYIGFWEDFDINEEFISKGDFIIEAYYLSTKCEILNINGVTPNENEIILPASDTEELVLKIVSDEKSVVEFMSDNVTDDSIALLSYGENIIPIKVTAEYGNSREYTLKVYRNSDKCSLIDVRNGKIIEKTIILDSVSCDTVSVLPSITVSDLAYFELYSDEKLTVKVDELVLVSGENRAFIKVIAENGNYSVYNILIVKRERLSTVNSSMVSGYYIPDISYIELSHSNSNAVIYYTTDGSIPDENSNVYEEPILFSQDITLNAVAICDGFDASAMQTFTYLTAGEIENIKVEQISGTNVILSFDPILGAEEIRFYLKSIDGDIDKVTSLINDENSMVLLSGLDENVYLSFLIEVQYANGTVTAQTEWVYVETDITSNCDVLSMNDPNAVIDNEALTITNMKVVNADDKKQLKANVSNGATYAFYPSRSSNYPYADNVVPLKEGKNTVFMKVTAADRITVKIYKITIYRNTKSDTPVISVENGQATITAAEGAKIVFSTDNSIPNIMTGQLYSSPFKVCEGMIIRAVADEDCKDEISEETVFVVKSTVPEVVIDTIDTTQTDKYIDFELNIVSSIESLPQSAVLIYAEYDSDGVFVKMVFDNITLNETDTIVSKRIYKTYPSSKIKIMLWSSIYSMIPLSAAV